MDHLESRIAEWNAAHDEELPKAGDEVMRWLDNLPKDGWQRYPTFLEKWQHLLRAAVEDVYGGEGKPDWMREPGAPDLSAAIICWLIVRDGIVPWNDPPYTGEMLNKAHMAKGLYAEGEGYNYLREPRHVPWLT